MKDTDYQNIVELTYMGGGFIPANENASELSERCVKGEVISVLECTQRDLKFHRCYFSLLEMIYGYMPPSFKKRIKKEKFYRFLKHLKKEYEVEFDFADGSQMIEYNSISFGRMSQKKFQEYVANQLPFIYSEVIGRYYSGEMYDSIVETIEADYEVFLNKLT